MQRTFRSLLVALLLLAITVAVPTSSGAATRTTAVTGTADRGGQDSFTRAEALQVLAKAQRQLRPDTRRIRAGRVVGHGPSTEVTMTLRDLHLARPALTGAARRQADALLARPTDPVGDDVDGTTPLTYPRQGRFTWCPTNGVACLHWVSTGTERIDLRDADADGVPDYVETVYGVVSQVWNKETGVLGYRTPLPDDGTPANADNPDPKLDIYLADLGRRGLYGYCAPEGAAADLQTPGYCVLDNDFAAKQYGIAPINALRVTTAHEFFHAVQFGYDVEEDVWMMEGSATWMEDEVYDSINDNYQFLADSPIRRPGTPLDYSVDVHRYGTSIFFTYAAERLRDRNVVRQFWEYADAPRHRYSLQAIRAVLAARRTNWSAFFSVFASWNTLPGGSYSERAGYPAPTYQFGKILSTRSKSTKSTGWRRVNLPHLSSSAIWVVPQARLKPRKNLLVEINAPNSVGGGTALVQRRFRNGAVTHMMVPLNRAGDGRALVRFDRRVLASVVVVVSNTSTAMRDCGAVTDGYGGPVYSCYGRGWFDRGQTFLVRASLR